MRPTDRNRFALCVLFSILLCSVSAIAQSTSQDFPTPVTSNEISGTIRPRDVGDARLTSYYYQFDGSQGDLFMNVVTRNFTGDIDVFIENGLRPLTKIVVYADLAETETGRVIYLRKPEKMILRVQGRTPGDEAATFRIKFAGSFVASSRSEPAAEPTLPSLTAKNESGIRVNSVGTIVEIIPKATPTPAPAAPEVVADDAEVKDRSVDAEKKERDAAGEVEAKEQPPTETPTEVPEKKVEVVVTDNLPKESDPAPATRARTRRGRTPAGTTPPAKANTAAEGPATVIPRRRRGRTTPPRVSEPKAPDPLEKVNLVILFKDGATIQRPLSEVLRFTVDKGVLTVIAKDGSIGRYSMLDVAKVTIE